MKHISLKSYKCLPGTCPNTSRTSCTFNVACNSNKAYTIWNPTLNSFLLPSSQSYFCHIHCCYKSVNNLLFPFSVLSVVWEYLRLDTHWYIFSTQDPAFFLHISMFVYLWKSVPDFGQTFIVLSIRKNHQYFSWKLQK